MLRHSHQPATGIHSTTGRPATGIQVSTTDSTHTGAVAAMTGSDVRAALTAPDPTAIDALGRSAREVIRAVVTAVVLDDGRGDPVADMRLELGSPGAASGDADTGPGGPPDPAVAGD